MADFIEPKSRVRFMFGTREEYNNVAHENNIIYILTDTQQICIGDFLLADGLSADLASQAYSLANTANNTANTANTRSNSNLTKINNLTTRVSTAEGGITTLNTHKNNADRYLDIQGITGGISEPGYGGNNSLVLFRNSTTAPTSSYADRPTHINQIWRNVNTGETWLAYYSKGLRYWKQVSMI